MNGRPHWRCETWHIGQCPVEIKPVGLDARCTNIEYGGTTWGGPRELWMATPERRHDLANESVANFQHWQTILQGLHFHPLSSTLTVVPELAHLVLPC